ncbi:NADP transhydrogenase subunit beta [Paraburkholderia xenovorans]|uniref:NADP transhydrogenase subunit beta n=1 Tax=Paraburkholderia xenovorans TaxID=36873 RepID=UPI0038B6BFCF
MSQASDSTVWVSIGMFGSAAGFAVMAGGFVCYLSASSLSAFADVERIELYAAVFAGALIFSASAISVCKMRGLFDVLNASAAARPGHRLVNLTALALCGWLGYMFVTGPAPTVGLEALLATGALAGALGAHLMLDGALAGHAAHSPTFAFAGRCHGFLVRERIEWRADEEPAWALREMPTSVRRMAAHRHARDSHDSTHESERRRAGARHRCGYYSVRRQR